MAGHRYRLILAAYRGGRTYEPVKPRYEYGIRSILRETLLLEADAIDRGARTLMQQEMMELNFIQFLDVKKVREELRNRMRKFGWLRQLMDMNLYAREPNPTLSSESLAKLYMAFVKAGILRDDVKDTTHA